MANKNTQRDIWPTRTRPLNSYKKSPKKLYTSLLKHVCGQRNRGIHGQEKHGPLKQHNGVCLCVWSPNQRTGEHVWKMICQETCAKCYGNPQQTAVGSVCCELSQQAGVHMVPLRHHPRLWEQRDVNLFHLSSGVPWESLNNKKNSNPLKSPSMFEVSCLSAANNLDLFFCYTTPTRWSVTRVCEFPCWTLIRFQTGTILFSILCGVALQIKQNHMS